MKKKAADLLYDISVNYWIQRAVDGQEDYG